MPETEWMDPDETSEYILFPKATLYYWRSIGEGPKANKVGRHLRYKRSDVDAWMESCAEPRGAA